MTRMIKRLLVVVGLATVASWASVNVAQGRSPAVGDGDCFSCSTNVTWTGCADEKHKDFDGGILHPNVFKGTAHSGCQDSPCDHTDYQQNEIEDLHLASEAMGDLTDDAILKALEGSRSVRLNHERSALQVVDANGAVILHNPLEKSQTERLAQALAANQTR